MNIVERAKEFATKAHYGQKRKYGNRDYIYHPEQVVKYLQNKGYNDENLLCAAWLHDVIEDCGVSFDELVKEFSYEVAHLVNEVSHPAAVSGNRQERWQVYIDHYNRASSLGKILKLADRVCNLREYLIDWSDLPLKAKKFLGNVYLDESAELLDWLHEVDKDVANDLEMVITEIDKFLQGD